MNIDQNWLKAKKTSPNLEFFLKKATANKDTKYLQQRIQG